VQNFLVIRRKFALQNSSQQAYYSSVRPGRDSLRLADRVVADPDASELATQAFPERRFRKKEPGGDERMGDRDTSNGRCVGQARSRESLCDSRRLGRACDAAAASIPQSIGGDP
jgi:hypothetical protein